MNPGAGAQRPACLHERAPGAQIDQPNGAPRPHGRTRAAEHVGAESRVNTTIRR
jgi:hypothetical protein